MKKVLFLSLLIANVSYGQIFTQSNTDGSILITPKGLQGKSNSVTDTTNVALGSSALRNNTNGNNNTATGYSALYFNTAGVKNTAFGAEALFHNETGYSNTASGYRSLYYNASGVANTAYGDNTLSRNTVGAHNTAHGFSALLRNGVGTANTAIGSNVLTNNTDGGSNTACGYGAGDMNSIGSFNTFLGAYANGLANNLTNSTAIGYNTVVDASNKVRIGNAYVTVIEGAVPFSTPSDRRLKHNISPSLLGLSFITRLAPMSYTYIADKTNVRRDGLIAQDVEKVMQELGVEFSGLQKSPDGTYSLAYSDFVMPLVNAAKELKQQNDEQQAKIEKLEEQNKTLEARLSALEELKAEITKLRADTTVRNADKK